LKKAGKLTVNKNLDNLDIRIEEKKLIKALLNFPEAIKQSTTNHNPATLTQHLFDLAKTFNNFYQQCPVLKAENENTKNFRLQLCLQSKNILAQGLNLLGIEAPEVM
jgi:arginyl-tRNA synthetase